MNIKEMVQTYEDYNVLTVETVKEVYRKIEEIVAKIPEQEVKKYLFDGADTIILTSKGITFEVCAERDSDEGEVAAIKQDFTTIFDSTVMKYVNCIHVDFAHKTLEFIMCGDMMEHWQGSYKNRYFKEVDTIPGEVREEYCFQIPLSYFE